jgi:RNA polymerase sigma-70 factor, ECF subfamily
MARKPCDAPRVRPFEAEVRPLMPTLQRMALWFTRDQERAQDLVQETLMKAYCGWKSFDPEQAKLITWIGAIMRNAYIDECRRGQLPTIDMETAEVNALLEPFCNDRFLEETEQRPTRISSEVLTAIRALPKKFRLPLVLADLADVDYADIADRLHLPLGTVKTHVFRAREMLGVALAEYAERRGYPSIITVRFLKNREKKDRLTYR